MAAILRDAYHFVFGEPITQPCLGVALAQCFLEHSHGLAIDNFCYGNITAGGNAGSIWTGEYFTIHFKPGTNPTDPSTMHFRSFDDHIAGARGYWDFLQHHCESALSRFEAGDPEGAAIALKAARYFTASLESYERAMVNLFPYAMKHIIPIL